MTVPEDRPADDPVVEAQSQAAFRLVEVLHEVEDLDLMRELLGLQVIALQGVAKRQGPSRELDDHVRILHAVHAVAEAVSAWRGAS